MYIFFALWGIIYTYTIVKKIHSLIQAKKCVSKLYNFVATYYEQSEHGNPDRSLYTKQLNALLSYYPIIASFYRYPALSYADSDETAFEKATELLCECRMIVNYKAHAVIRSLNPLISLKKLVMFPASLVAQFGFRLGKRSSLFINVLGWFAAYLLTMFSAEIKALLTSVFQQLV